MYNFSTWTTLTGVYTAMGGSITRTVTGLCLLDSNTLFVSGASFSTTYGIAKYNISGATWTQIGTGLIGSSFIQSINAIAKISSTQIIVGGNITTSGGSLFNGIAVYNNTNGQWAQFIASVTPGTIESISAVSPTVVFFSTSNGLFRINNAGTDWVNTGVTTGWSSSSIFHVYAADSSNVYFSGSFNTAPYKFVAKWNGTSAVRLGSGVNINGVYSIAGTSASNVYFGGNFTAVSNLSGDLSAKYIAKWAPQSSAISSFPTPTPIAVTTDGINHAAACMYNNYVLVVSASGGAMRRSTDYGATYIAVTNSSFTNVSWRAIAIDQTQAIALTTTSQFTSNDYGATWTERTLPTRTGDPGVGCDVFNGLMIVTDAQNGLLHYSTNNGVSWLSQSVASINTSCSITMDGTNYIVGIIIGDTINICKNFDPSVTTNTFVPATTYNGTGGTNPTQIALDGQYGIAGCWAGTASRIKYSSDYGLNWTDATPAINVPVGAISFSRKYATFANYETTFHTSNDNGKTWTARSTPNGFAATCTAGYLNAATVYTWTGTAPNGYYGVLS